MVEEYSPRDGHIGMTGTKTAHGMFDRQQRRGTGGIDGVAGAADVEPIRRTTGNDVRNGGRRDDDEVDDDDRVPTSTVPKRYPHVFGTGAQIIPRNAFGRPEDEITSDFRLPGEPEHFGGRPLAPGGEVTQPLPPWKPLTDDEQTETEALIVSLRGGPATPPEGERGPGRPGLN
jgi:hypothetical protein